MYLKVRPTKAKGNLQRMKSVCIDVKSLSTAHTADMVIGRRHLFPPLTPKKNDGNLKKKVP